MNCYYFFAVGHGVKEYLGGTNYFTHWDSSKSKAIATAKKYFKEGTYIECLNDRPKGVAISYLR